MTDEKWRSPTRHSIASDVTDKLPPKGEARDDVQGDLLSRIEKMLSVQPDKDGCFKSLHDLGMWISRAEAALIKRALAQQQTNEELLNALKDAVFLWDAEKSLINKDDINKWREVIKNAEQKGQNHE